MMEMLCQAISYWNFTYVLLGYANEKNSGGSKLTEDRGKLSPRYFCTDTEKARYMSEKYSDAPLVTLLIHPLW